MSNRKSNSRSRRRKGRTEFLLGLRKEFYREYSTEASHILQLCIYAGSNAVSVVNGIPAFKCRFCSSTNLEISKNSRRYRCKDCGDKGSFTAGGFFASVKKPPAWNMAIFFIRKGVAINSKELEFLAEISQSAAWWIMSKISKAIFEKLIEVSVIVSSARFADQITKRSLVTPAGLRPYEELEQLMSEQKGHVSKQEFGCDLPDPESADSDNSSSCASDLATSDLATSDPVTSEPVSYAPRTSDPTSSHKESAAPFNMEFSGELEPLAEIQRFLLSLICREPISFEQLCAETGLPAGQVSAALTVLELNDKVNCLPGNHYQLSGSESNQRFNGASGSESNQRYNSASGPDLIETNSIEEPSPLSEGELALVRAILEFLFLTYSGISRKYLQFYLALFWLVSQPACRSTNFINAAFKKMAPIKQDDVRSFESPLFVQLPLAA